MPRPITQLGFFGAQLAQDPTQLPPGIGVDAVDLEIGRDRFTPLRGRTSVAEAEPGTVSIWRMNRSVINDALYWLGWESIVTAALFFNSGTTERTLYVGDDEPKWTDNILALGGGEPYPQAWRSLGVPRPGGTAPGYNIAGAPPLLTLDTEGPDGGTERFVFVVYTYVNEYGWESAPSAVSNGLLCKPGAIIDIANLADPPSGTWGTFTSKRIYITQPDSNSNTEFFFLREVSIGVTASEDDARARGGLLPTDDGTTGAAWLMPPHDAFDVIGMWAGMHAMLSPSGLHICEYEAPYAWPAKNDRKLKNPGVALGRWSQNLAVLTTGEPIIYQGLDAASLAPLPPTGISMPCRSKRGVVSFPDGVAFPSSDGLGWLGDGPALNLTRDIFTREQWDALNPSTMIAGRWRGFYVCSYVVGGGPTRRGFMVNPKDPGAGVVWLSSGFDACHFDDFAERLYVLEGTDIRSFATSDHLTGSHTSGQYLQTFPVNYGWLKVVADAYPVEATVTATVRNKDGTLRTYTEERTITSDRAHSLKGRFAAMRWQVKVENASPITAWRLATSAEHLQGL